MAPSLRDLIDFLLAEIALCGTQGASPADILSLIDVFYARFANDRSDRSHVVDRRFQEKVWLWLTRNPEVSVGKKREWNELSLEDAERRQLKMKDAEEVLEIRSSPVRVFVSEERIWLAITGHEPDETKVLPLEFALLSIIASRKSSGISQPELIQLSGQDKRSVPKRTDGLQKKGYIEKRAIQIKAARTSLCTLRKFSTPENLTAENLASETSAAGADSNKMIDFRWLTNTLFQILREHKIISRTDLKDLLGFTDRWRWRVLSRALRKFERIGVLKRVRALSQYAQTFKKYHPCVMLVREPSEKDIELFHDFSKHMYSDIDQNEDAEFEDDAEVDDGSKEPSSTENIGVMEGEGDVDMSGRILPLWSPDRNIHNQLFEAVERTGTIGSTNSDVIRTCLGVFYRRPLENTLARLVECWQLSQPPHLRHLAIVRDTALQRTITHYVHYSARNFSKLVDAGESSWEAVEFHPKNPKSDNSGVPPVDAKPHLDSHGLPLDVPVRNLLNNGDSSLLECMLVGRPRDYNCSSSDPRAIKSEDGTYTIHFGVRSRAQEGQGYQPPAGGLTTPNAPRWSKNEDEGVPGGCTGVMDTSGRKPPKKVTRDSLSFYGMSEKEKLEAMGMDETWTEYNALLMDRPGPGVYVTPRGRRKAAGRRQGRPRISRVAVFKSPKLLTLPWFKNEKGDEPNDKNLVPQTPQTHNGADSRSGPVTRNSVEPESAQEPTVTRGIKRLPQRRSSDSKRDYMSPRASKLRCIRAGGASISLENPQAELGVENGRLNEMHVGEPQTPSHSRVKRKRAASPESEQQGTARVRKRGSRVSRPLTEDTNQGGSPRIDTKKKVSPKRPSRKHTHQVETEASQPRVSMREDRGQSAGLPETFTGVDKGQGYPPNSMVPNENLPSTSKPVTESPPENNPTPGNPPLEDSVPLEAGSAIRNKVSGDALINGASSMEPSTTGAPANKTAPPNVSATPEGSSANTPRSKLPDKGGSVAFIRRKIVMEIVDKAGGAFSTGPELWYPFMTAWMKTKYKERPDMRTIRTAVKHLVDAGRLRQQTFCGKEKKGVMVTKTIICKPDLSPDDPIIKDLQENILASESRYYIPPNVEVEPSLTKQWQTPKGFKHSTEIPVEPSLTVQLHQKPAVILALEKRKGESIQRSLLKKHEIQRMRESMQKKRPSGVVRLLSIQHPNGDSPAVQNMGSFFGDEYAMARARKRRTFTGDPDARRLKRLGFPISSMAPYAMLMNPKQSFNPGNGTFSTNAGLAALNVGRTISTAQHRTVHKQDLQLPESLHDIFTQTQIRNVAVPGETDPRSRNFFRDNDRILRWELKNEELLQQRSEGLHYINQTIQDSFESAPIEGGIHFDPGETDIAPGSAVRTRQQAALSPTIVQEEHPPFPSPPLPPPIFEPRLDWEAPPRPPSPVPINSVMLPHYELPPAIPRQRRLEKLNELVAPGNDTTNSSQNRPPIRRTRVALQLPRSTYQKLLTAIVVVRALAGGSDGRMVDWVLVSNCFPDQDPKLIQDKGKSFLSRNRLQVAKMQSDFHERFIDAYVNDEVPPINYDDLENYDWNAIIEWATDQLDVPRSEKIPDLPATRDQFDDIFELREEPLGSLDEYYQSQSITVNRKRALLSNVAFAAPLLSKSTSHRSHRHLELSRLDTVKTWVRANTLTPAEVYRSADARAALSYIDGGLLNNALQSLVTERVVSQNSKGRPVPGRNYDVTDHFIFTLSKRRPIEIAELRRASKFKTNTLDPALTIQGLHSVSYNAEDGDILALINLFSEGRITLSPRDPPRDKYGLTDGGYLTRLMNKDKLRFPVDIHPVKNNYTTGNPVIEKAISLPPPSPPRIAISETISLPEKLPLWMDIHGGFIQVLWDLALGAVLGSVATRPGVTAAGIAGMIKPTMGAWEVQMLLEWLVEVGVVQRKGADIDESSWAVTEWWWMVLG
ncbi:hypothetical protein BDW59DRAFT_178551 [Aspergillus cavernicola]|uniref:TFIIIC transcription initiation factor complex subunits Tfc3 n=1 Tax=Aspergillus cavernicola TaxID=176166 RepID=A0ABR4IN57_9EURO